MTADKEFAGKVALVTASSRGIGYATAERLGRAGAAVVINGRDPVSLDAAVKRLASDGVHVYPEVGDLADPDTRARLLAAPLRHFGRFDILVANVGGPPLGAFVDTSMGDWAQALNAGLVAVVDLIRGAGLEMRARQSGAIVLVTSTWAREPRAGAGVSSVIRAASAALVKVLSREFGADAIRVNHVLPGPTWTERSRQNVARMATAQGISETDVRRRVLERIPLKRYGEAADIAEAIAFLASDRASFVTGVGLQVDGGQLRGVS